MEVGDDESQQPNGWFSGPRTSPPRVLHRRAAGVWRLGALVVGGNAAGLNGNETVARAELYTP
jgi:hypothetical protein